MREPELLEKGWVEGLAESTATALREVEHQIGRDPTQPIDELLDGARNVDRLHRVTETGENAREHLDRLLAVELRLFLACGAPQVERQSDVHRRLQSSLGTSSVSARASSMPAWIWEMQLGPYTSMTS